MEDGRRAYGLKRSINSCPPFEIEIYRRAWIAGWSMSRDGLVGREYYLNTHPDTIKIEQEIEILRRKLVEVHGELNKGYLDANPRPIAQYTPNLPDLEKNFGKLSFVY